MRRWSAELERREAIRRPRRLPCAVWVGRDRHEGVLEEVSAHAVVVRMEEVPPGLREALLTFATPSGVSFALRAMPVRGRVVSHTLRGLLPPSVVFHVREPTRAYLRWVEEPPAEVS